MKKSVRGFPVYLFILIISQLLIIYYIFQDVKGKEEIYFNQLIRGLRGEYKSIIFNYNYLSQLTVNELIRTDDILELIARANNPELRDVARDELFHNLNTTYRDLKGYNIKQLHFHLPDGTSLLRMHKPEKFGDNLLRDRPSVSYVSMEHKPIHGFEEGKIYNGIRYVFPLFWKGDYVGSVECSYDFNAIRQSLQNSLYSEIHLIVKRAVLERKLFEKEFDNYLDCKLTNDYLYERSDMLVKMEDRDSPINYELFQQINDKLQPYVSKKIMEGNEFVARVVLDWQIYLGVFEPIYSVDGEQTAFMFSYFRDDILKSVYRDQIITYLIYTLLTIILMIIVKSARDKSYKINRQLRKNNDRLNEEVERHKFTSNMLQESERRFRDVAVAAGEYIWEVDRSFQFRFVTRKVKSILGYTSNELIGKSVLSFIPAEERQRVRAMLEDCSREGRSFNNLQHRVIHKDGSIFWQKVSAAPTFGDDRQVTGFRGASLDITDIKNAERDLNRKDMLLQAVSFSAGRFLASSRWDDVIDDSLKILGIALNASRVFFAEKRLDKQRIMSIVRHEWCDNDIRSGNFSNNKIEQSDDNPVYGKWFERFSKGRIVLGSIGFLSKAEQEELLRQEIKSILYIPIMVNREWWGYVGFEECKEERAWTRIEVEILKTAADTLAAAIERELSNTEVVKLSTAVAQSSSAVIVTDEKGQIEFLNPRYTEITGYRLIEKRGKLPMVLESKFHADEDYVRIMDAIKEGKFWKGEFLSERKNGERYWEGVSIAPVLDSTGDLTNFIMTVNDTTERKRYIDALRFRADFEEIINKVSTRFINIPVEKVDEEIVASLEVVGDFIGVDRSYVFIIKNETGFMDNTHEWCNVGIDCQKDQLQDIPLDVFPWWINRLSENKNIQLNSLDDMPESAASEKSILENQDIKSLLVLPLNYRHNLIGFIGFDAVKDYKQWSDDSVNLLRIIGETFVSALKRKESEEKFNNLYKSLLNELDLASSVQSYLLPKWINVEKDLILSQTYTPSSKIGGDLFDMVPINDTEYIVYIADISGHGVQAALIMMAVKSVINMLINNEKENIPSPCEIVTRLNKILTREVFKSGVYMTLLLCVIDVESNKIRYFNAGHPSMIKYSKKTGKAIILKDTGSIPIGWVEDMDYLPEEEDEISFDPDSIFVMYTDGIFECENIEGEQLGVDGLIEVLNREELGSRCVTLPSRVKQQLVNMKYDITEDDFTLVALEFTNDCNNGSYRKIFDMASVLHVTGEVGSECAAVVSERYNDAALAFSVEIIINEYLNNVISHGLQSKSDTSIAMEIEVSNSIYLRFWDQGAPWELPSKTDVIQHYEEKDIEDESGRGLYIIYMNSADFRLKRYSDLNETVIRIDTGESNAKG